MKHVRSCSAPASRSRSGPRLVAAAQGSGRLAHGAPKSRHAHLAMALVARSPRLACASSPPGKAHQGCVQSSRLLSPDQASRSAQVLLLQLAAFLDAAWPPPALDPLTVRTSITLEEIVAERLVGPLRGYQAQKLRQSRQQLQAPPDSCVVLRTLRCLFLCQEAMPERDDPGARQSKHAAG